MRGAGRTELGAKKKVHLNYSTSFFLFVCSLDPGYVAQVITDHGHRT